MTFPIRVDSPFRPWLILFGVLRSNAYVRLSESEIHARFGFFSLHIEIGQVGRWEIQGPYRWWSAIGVRGTFGQPEITFGGSAHGGVALFLGRPIPRWWWVRNLSQIYFTVEDPEGLAAELQRRGIPGQDVREGVA